MSRLLTQLNLFLLYALSVVTTLDINNTVCNDEKCYNSLQEMLLGSYPRIKRSILCKDPPEGFHFCYYFIRIMDNYWKLGREFDTTNKAVIENCMKTTTYTYGFTYYVNLSERTYIDDHRMQVKHLLDIFYYCCKDCSHTNNMTNEEIANFIANLLLRNLPKPNNGAYISNESLPYCMLEDGALAKSLADVISMNFSKICPKSECIYYLSPLEFFFYCCCDKNFELCTYTSDEKLLSYASKNAESWLNDPSIRSFQETIVYDIRTDLFEKVLGRPWTYRKFVYSRPTVNEFTGNVTPSKNNIPLHLCAFGTYNVTIGNWNNDEFKMKIGKRKVLGEPQKFCYFTASLQFMQTDRKPPTSLEMSYGSDTKEMCKREGCKIEAPNCLQNLISKDYEIARFKCCCDTDDLCNHLGNKYFEVTEKLTGTTHNFPCMSQSHSYLMIYFNYRFNDTYIKCSRFFLFDTYDEVMLIEDYSFYAPENLALKKLFDKAKKLHLAGKNYDMTVQHGCTRKIFLPILDPFCKVYLPVLTNVIQCSCFQSPLLHDPCDYNFEKIVREEGSKITVPTCFRTHENLKNLSDDKYNFGFIGPATYIKMEVKNYPLCYDMLAINPYKRGIEHRSGPFDEIVDYLYNTIGIVGRIRRIMTFKVNQPNTNRSTIRYLFTCFQRENFNPCNGPMNIRDQLLPLIIREESAKYIPKDRSLCHVNDHSNRVRCKSRKGCFDFRSVHGIRMRGCIDKIPKIVSKMPEMRLLYTCYNYAWITSNKRKRCSAVIENASNSSIPLVDGIICCCRSTCSTFNSNSYMEMQHGYYPFPM